MTQSTIVRRMAAVALGGILFATGIAVAGEGHREKSPEQRMARIEQGVRERLAPKLGLDERTTERLVEITRVQMAKRQAAMETVRKERRALRDLLDNKAPDAAIETQLRKLEDAQAAMPTPGAVLTETRRILTPKQQAELALLLPKIGRKGHHRGPPGGPGDWNDKAPPAAPAAPRTK